MSLRVGICHGHLFGSAMFDKSKHSRLGSTNLFGSMLEKGGTAHGFRLAAYANLGAYGRPALVVVSDQNADIP